MKKSSKLIVVMVAAAITFGSLFVLVGTDHWDKYQQGRHGHYHHDCVQQDEGGD